MKNSWTINWQNELLWVLRLYHEYRSSHKAFFLYLLIFFFGINATCYWLAVLSSFPEMLSIQLARTAIIQQPVALMGGLFDALSFFLTVHLIKFASVAKSGLRLIGILAIDLLIAAVATAWVLFFVMITSWVIGPPETYGNQSRQTIAISEPELQADVIEVLPLLESQNPNLLVGDANKQASQPDEAQVPILDDNEVIQTIVKVEPDPRDINRMVNGQTEFDSAFYQDLIVDALKNPGANIKYFLFGVIMGLSTMLPSVFHLWAAFKSYRLSRVS